MKKTKLAIVLISILILFCFCCFAEAADEGTVYMMTPDNALIRGEWNESDYLGADNSIVYKSIGGNAVQWKFKSPSKYNKIYFWKCLSEDGCANAVVNYSSKTCPSVMQSINLSRGKMGFVELGCFSMTNEGAQLTFSGNNGFLYASAIKVVPVGEEYETVEQLAIQDKNSVVLFVNKPFAFVGGVTSAIDDVTPIVVDDRALIPARFVSESLGAEVEWNPDTLQATISMSNTVFVFTTDNSEYTVNGDVKYLDSPATVINDRLMLPVRVIAENIGKKVAWNDCGLIVLSDIYDDGTLNEKFVTDFIKIFE